MNMNFKRIGHCWESINGNLSYYRFVKNNKVYWIEKIDDTTRMVSDAQIEAKFQEWLLIEDVDYEV